MKIENNLAIDEEDFSAIEEHYGCTLDAGLRRFITQYNGIIEGPEYGVDIEYKSFSGRTITDSFCEILHTQTILKMLPRLGFINDFFDDDGLTSAQVEPATLLPVFGVAGGGLLIYIAVCGVHKNKLFTVDNGDFGIGLLEISLEDIAARLG